MFDKLVDVILDFIRWFQFWVIIDVEEVGLIYTLGRDTWVIRADNGWFGTGLHLIAPFDIEEVKTVNIQWGWENLSYQSLETNDGKLLIVQVGYKYRLRSDNDGKIRKFFVYLGDEDSTRRLAIGAAVCSVVANNSHEELKKGETEIELPLDSEESEEESDEESVTYVGIKKQILDIARGELTPWGYQIGKIEWLQRTQSRTYRIMQDQTTVVNKISMGDPEEE
jgi:hypothetical protein